MLTTWSLRTKITLALLAMSFGSIGVVVVTAKSITEKRFDRMVMQNAEGGFLRDATRYYESYGSWENAVAAESFASFVGRTRGGPGDGRPSPERRRAETRSDRPQSHRHGGPPPPFVVTDEKGVVLVPTVSMKMGERVSKASLAKATPIEIEGRVEGMAVPLRAPVATAFEQEYLSAIQRSLWITLLLALGVCLPLGFLLGGRLTKPIRNMTEAMRAMKAGDLRHNVRGGSKDELGLLAESFNRMSANLADAYEKLEGSKERIDEYAREMAELSLRDELTGLPNRRAFSELASAMVAHARRYDHKLSVAMIDIDHFKQINDENSHAVGDLVLTRAATILELSLRETDLVARWGGEEFAAMFPETDREVAQALSERIRSAFEDAQWDDLLPNPVTISVGIAEVMAGESLSDGLLRADEKLYEAKDEGRNRVHG